MFRFLHTSTRLCGWVYVPSHLIFVMNQFWLRYLCSCAAWEQDLFCHSRVLVLRPACSHIVSGIIEWLEQQHFYVYGAHLRRQCRKPGERWKDDCQITCHMDFMKVVCSLNTC